MARFSPCLGRGPGVLQQYTLTGFDEQLGVFDGGVLQDAMAEIENVALAGERINGVQGHVSNLFLRAEKDGRIDVTLQSDFRAQRLSNFGQVYAPIKT
jgi:hypothetical protein